MQPLREEVESILKQEGGITIPALTKMRSIDSFLKECQRLDVLDCRTHFLRSMTFTNSRFISVTLMRLARRDFTFSDGTTVPAGAFVAAAKVSTHFNDAIYDVPYEFNPWRFLRSDEGQEGSTDHRMAHITPEYLPFSIGVHAWCVSCCSVVQVIVHADVTMAFC